MPASQLIPQRDDSFLVTPGDGREQLLDVVRCCAQLVRIVAGNFSYRLSDVALWGAAARGIAAEDVVNDLERVTTDPLPAAMVKRIVDTMARYGVVHIVEIGGTTYATAADVALLRSLTSGICELDAEGRLELADYRAVDRFRMTAASAGWPVNVTHQRARRSSRQFHLRAEDRLRSYQRDALRAWVRAGDGVIVLPCGAGKTVIGVAAAVATGERVLILTPSRTIGEQWQRHVTALTTVPDQSVGLLERDVAISPVTIATYHAATGSAAHRLADQAWDLVIFDEVHTLPADLFRETAAFPAGRRLGLTATLVREDGREREIVGLVGPVVYDASWLELEAQGWIAPARCVEVRVPAPPDLSAVHRYKLAVTERILGLHPDEPTLVMGTDLALLHATAATFDLPILTGATPQRDRRRLLEQFRAGERSRIVMSRVGTAGVDLPSASVLIQVSGTFGSRQEEAQRLGRLLRPAPGKVAHFYTVVVDRKRDIAFAERRQRYLVDRGYRYELVNAADLPRVR